MGETELSHDNSVKFSLWPAKMVEIKVLSLLEGCLDLIPSPSLSVKIQIVCGNYTQKSGIQIPAPEGQVFFPFSFHFQILHIKLQGHHIENEKDKTNWPSGAGIKTPDFWV